MSAYDWAMLKAHTPSVLDVVTDSSFDFLKYFVIRLETMQSDLSRLQRRLCWERYYCQRLPLFPHLRRTRHRSAKKRLRWTSGARAAALLRYSSDFVHFGYSDDPSSSRLPT